MGRLEPSAGDAPGRTRRRVKPSTGMHPLAVARALFGVAAMLALSVALLLLAYGMMRFGQTDRALRLAPHWARACLRLLGLRLEVHGREHLPPQGHGFIAAASHASALDLFVYTAVLPFDVRYIAKRELQRLPVFAGAFLRSGNIFVDRDGNPETRARFNTALREYPERPIFIYPEGTRSHDGSLQPLKHGIVHISLATGFSVLPIVSRGARESLPKGRWLPRPGRITVHIGPPISSADWRVETIDPQIAELHDAMNSLIGESESPS